MDKRNGGLGIRSLSNLNKALSLTNVVGDLLLRGVLLEEGDYREVWGGSKGMTVKRSKEGYEVGSVEDY